MKTRSVTNKMVKATRKRAAETYEVDIAEEFKDVKTSINSRIDQMSGEIRSWKSVVEQQLTKLNSNMERVLSTIANHEARLGEVEKKLIKNETKQETVSEMTKFMWFAAKGLIGAGILVGGILGTAGAWRMLFPAA